jgi:hypothetical protein
MAKKRQPTTTATAKDDQPLTPASKNDQPPPSKKPEEEKVEEKEDEEVTSEEASSSEGEEDDEEDDDEEQTPSSKTVPPAKSESKKDELNEDEEETDTDSDSDQEPPPKLKSINLKSIDETLKSKPQPKSSAAPARSGTKRSADDDTKQSKKKKTIAAAAADDEKVKEVDNKKSGDDSKKLFVRVFNEDDELAILKGFLDFTEKTGTDPLKYPTAFYNDVKTSIHFPVTLDQLKDKVRRLKLKFENKMKSCKNGKTPNFSKPIEEKMFEFGKKIWGGTIVEENGKPNLKPSKKKLAVKKSPTTKVMEPDLPLMVWKETSKVGSSVGKENPDLSLMLNEMEQFDRSVSSVFGSGTDLLKSGVELIEESKRVELERRWNELRVTELKLVEMRAALVEDQASWILDAMKSASSD